MNMIFTLLCCFMILVVREQIKNPILRMALVTGLVLLTMFSDWPILAAVYTILFDTYKNTNQMKKAYGIAYVSFALFSILSYSNAYPIQQAIVHGLLAGVAILVSGVFTLVLYNGKRAEHGKNFSKWFFYLFYPAHLLILGFIKTIW